MNNASKNKTTANGSSNVLILPPRKPKLSAAEERMARESTRAAFSQIASKR